MLKSLTLLSLAATFTIASAQSTGPAPLVGSDQSQPPAPIVRSDQHRPRPQPDQITESQPTPGVWLRSESTSVLKTVSATPQHIEIRLDRGRLNVNVHQPAQHSAILIDLSGGQTSLLKDGLYTFNADTNTVRVLRGEAAAYPGPIAANADARPIKIKEDHQLSLVSATDTRPGEAKSVESYPYELTADLLPLGNSGDRAYAGGGYEGGLGYGDGEDYPLYGGYPYAGGWGYPGFYPGYYGYGYPFAYGIGFGYYGGFHGGYGYRGVFRR